MQLFKLVRIIRSIEPHLEIASSTQRLLHCQRLCVTLVNLTDWLDWLESI